MDAFWTHARERASPLCVVQAGYRLIVLLLSAFLLGLVFNAAPGPVFAATLRAGARGGFRAAAAVQFGSLAGDAAWAVAGLAGVSTLLQVDWLLLPLGVIGALYLLWLAFDSWRSASAPVGTDVDGHEARSAIRTGALLSLTNPQNIAYWAAMGSAMANIGLAEPTSGQMAVFFAGFMAASIAWCFICAALVERVFLHLGPGWAAITCRACSLAFLVLAALEIRGLLIGTKRQRDTAVPAVTVPQR